MCLYSVSHVLEKIMYLNLNLNRTQNLKHLFILFKIKNVSNMSRTWDPWDPCCHKFISKLVMNHEWQVLTSPPPPLAIIRCLHGKHDDFDD